MAAAAARRRPGVARVAILDWDVHHGNGVPPATLGHVTEQPTPLTWCCGAVEWCDGPDANLPGPAAVAQGPSISSRRTRQSSSSPSIGTAADSSLARATCRRLERAAGVALLSTCHGFRWEERPRYLDGRLRPHPCTSPGTHSACRAARVPLSPASVPLHPPRDACMPFESIQAGLGDCDYHAAFELLVMPILRQFAPSLLLISAGFDAALGDVQGKMRVSPAGFAAMTRMLLTLPECAPVVVFEGGYHLDASAECTEAVLRVLIEADAAGAGGAGADGAAGEGPTETACMRPSGGTGEHTEMTLRKVLEMQREHWESLRTPEHALAFDAYFGHSGPRQSRKRTR